MQTFADPEVKKLLDEQLVFVEVNTDHEEETARWFAGSAIPDTRILGLDGRTMDRVVGFEEPPSFAARLRRAIGRE